jgi:UDP-N-acetylglucosamine 4,6-dehydratase
MKLFNNKKVLVTGGTGSFGNAFIKKILKTNVKELRIFSRDEKKQFDLRNIYKDERINFIIGDVRDFKSVLSATDKIDYVFHAAALKQVPSCEFFPMEALKTNIIGSDNVINASIENNVKKCILLSTDKAVYPINTMGLTKSFAEKIMTSKILTSRTSKTIICATRYGNVMGSRGSVIPLFIDQIKNNKIVTITNKNMTRFMMSLDESINLVFKAFKDGTNGDIFVQKSPACTMYTLYKSLKKILKSNSRFKEIGIRYGEKMHETLVSEEEMLKTKNEKQFYIIQTNKKNEKFDNFFFKGKKNIKKINKYDSTNTQILNENQLTKLLKKNIFSK